MFWIGLIVGAIITISIAFGWIAVCCKIVGVTKDEFCNAQDTIATALVNRESEMVITHDGEVIASCIFEEK